MKKTIATVALVASSASVMLYAAHAQEVNTGAKLQSRQPLFVERSIEKLPDGIRVTQTTKDAETLTRLHKRADRENLMSQINTTVTNIDNGVKITRTSENAEAVSFLQEEKEGALGDRPLKERDASHPEVERIQSNIPNGVEILITTTDAEAVSKIQEMHAKMSQYKGAFPKMHGKEGKRGGKHGGQRGDRTPLESSAS